MDKIKIVLNIEQVEKLLSLHRHGFLKEYGVNDAKIIANAAAEAIINKKINLESYDVFICHNSSDKSEVKRIATRLRNEGILPWLDEWELRPGFPW